MAKIKTYNNADPVTLSDKVIGTAVGDTPPNATRNFLISDIVALATAAGATIYTGDSFIDEDRGVDLQTYSLTFDATEAKSYFIVLGDSTARMTYGNDASDSLQLLKVTDTGTAAVMGVFGEVDPNLGGTNFNGLILSNIAGANSIISGDDSPTLSIDGMGTGNTSLQNLGSGGVLNIINNVNDQVLGLYTKSSSVNDTYIVLDPLNSIAQFYTSTVEAMRLLSTGQMRLGTYGSGTHTGTATYTLNVDASGNVIEGPLGGGGGNGIYGGSDTVPASVVATLTDTLTFTGGNVITDRLLTGDGTNALPSLSFENDSDTGFYTNLAGEIMISNNGQNRHVIGSAYIRSGDTLGYQVNRAAGSESSPTYTFRDDNNTGMWRPTAGEIAFSNGGVESARIDSSGNVGIGTTNPVSTLHVAGEQQIHTNNHHLSTYSSIGTLIGRLTYSGTTFRLQGQDGTQIVDSVLNVIADFNEDRSISFNYYGLGNYTGTAAYLLGVDATGNVIEEDLTSFTNLWETDANGIIPTGHPNIGLGIASDAAYQLRTSGDLRFGNLIVQDIGNDSYIQKSSAAGTFLIRNTQQDHALIFRARNTTNGYSTELRLDGSGEYMTATTGGTERMRIDSDGNIGINESSPTELLHIKEDSHNVTALLEGGDGANKYAGYKIITGAGTPPAQGGISLEASRGTSSSIPSISPFEAQLVSLYGVNLSFGGDSGGGGVNTANLIMRLFNATQTVSIGTPDSSKKLTVEDGTSGEQVRWRYDASNYVTIGATSAGYYQAISTGARYGFGINPTKDFHISKAQNAYTEMELINTTDGTAARTGLSLTSNAAQKIQMYMMSSSYSSSGLNVPSRGIITANGSGGFYFGASHSSGDVGIFSGGLGSSNIRVFLDSGGDVGIGTNNPTEQLHVAGTIKLENTSASATLEIENNTNNWFLYGLNSSNNFIIKPGTNDGDLLFRDQAGSDIMTLDTATGNLGINTTSPTEKLDIDGDAIRVRSSQTPSSASATGDAGTIAWDSSYIYICTATNTWKRVAIATW